MDAQILTDIGLNPNQAKAYLALARFGSLTPPLLATEISVTRTNAYELLGQLEALGLCGKDGSGKRLHYHPTHPSALESLIKSRREAVFAQEGRLQALMPQLLSYFYTYSDQPGVRFFQGREGIIEVYKDILRTKQKVYLMRTKAETDFLGQKFMDEYITQRIKIGIEVEAITPLPEDEFRDPESDKAMLYDRTRIPLEHYTAPVEIDVYGDKVAFISFGEEAVATVIQSPQLSLAMKQVFAIMRHGAPALARGANNALSSHAPGEQMAPWDQIGYQMPLWRDCS